MTPASKPCSAPAAGLFGNQQADTRKCAPVPSETARAFSHLFVTSEAGEEPPAPQPRNGGACFG